MSAKKRYPYQNGKYSIEVKLKTPHQLFNERDPAPFRERDLDDEFVQYIKTAMSEFKKKDPVRLSIFCSEMHTARVTPQEIIDAIHSFFTYESELQRREIQLIFRQGHKSLWIGLGFLLISVVLGNLLSVLPSEIFRQLARESSYLIGWVAMWKPINIFLYDWWPLADMRKVYIKLSEIEVLIHESN